MNENISIVNVTVIESKEIISVGRIDQNKRTYAASSPDPSLQLH